MQKFLFTNISMMIRLTLQCTGSLFDADINIDDANLTVMMLIIMLMMPMLMLMMLVLLL